MIVTHVLVLPNLDVLMLVTFFMTPNATANFPEITFFARMIHADLL